MYIYIYVCVCISPCTQLLSRVRLFAIPRAVVHQVPLSIGFSRQEYWSGLLFPSPGVYLQALGEMTTSLSLEGVVCIVVVLCGPEVQSPPATRTSHSLGLCVPAVIELRLLHGEDGAQSVSMAWLLWLGHCRLGVTCLFQLRGYGLMSA